uniref:Uncharacterized protein n=1 Tax=Stegastes partitus TaxID=144197 RepID=A0A3B4Z7Y2_9TELE
LQRQGSALWLMLGLDGAGKTTILLKLKQDEFMLLFQTIGYNLETGEHNDLEFTFFDLGSRQEL